MTTPASGAISIQSLKNEWPHLNYNNMSAWAQGVLGYTPAVGVASVSLSQFRGLTYTPPGPSTANYTLAHGTISTAHGNVLMNLLGPPNGYVLFSNNNPTAWSKTNYFVINGNTVYPASFEYVGGGGDYYIYWVPDAWGSPAGTFNMTTT